MADRAQSKRRFRAAQVRFSARLRRILWSESCVSCGERDAGDEILCPACAAAFQRKLAQICPNCGSPRLECLCVPPRLADAGCEFLVKLAAYDASQPDCPLNRMIHRMKHIRDRECAAFLAGMLAGALEKLLCDRGVERSELIVTFIPRDPDKILVEGHDQARMLARALADRMELECIPLFRRRRGAADQKTLTAEERDINVRTLFSLSREAKKTALDGKTVILVDDLVTTGATSAACVRLLRDAGCLSVYAAAVAYTPLKPGAFSDE